MSALQATTLPARTIYLAAIAVSLLLSAWASYVQYVPNPDAALYLRAAELFSSGQWSEGAAVYRWPTYSVIIAAVMGVTGLQALVAAHLVNSLFYVLITVAFIALLGRLGRGDRVVLACAALIVVMHPRLLQMRSSVIRDHGFYAFLLVSFYWIVRDQQEPRFWSKIYALGAILLAAAFRIEAMFVAALVPAYYLFTQARSPRGKLLVFGGTALIGSLLLPGLIVWSTGGIQRWIFPEPGFDHMEVLERYFDDVQKRLWSLEVVLAPWGRGLEWVSYLSLTIGITVYGVLRALTWPLALLAALAFVPRRLIPDYPARLVLWFAGWQIPVLLLFVFFNAFITWRYGMTVALLMTIPAVFTVAWVARDWLSGTQTWRWPAAATLALVVGLSVLYFPKPNRLAYLMEAAQWIKENTPPSARIMTNDGRIAYFSGRKYDAQIIITGIPTPPSEQDWEDVDFAVINVDRGGVPAYVASREGAEFLATVSEGRGRKVVAYRMR
jgi:hypothetical protein